MYDDVVHGGRFYGRLTPDGPLVPVVDVIGEPDAWICRRLADFPSQQIPAGGKLTECSRCGVAIVFNPQRKVNAPKICMPCASIRPLPIES